MKELLALWEKQPSKTKTVIVLGAIATLAWTPILIANEGRGSAPRTIQLERPALEKLFDHNLGFSVYFDGSCVSVRGLTDGHLKQMGTDLHRYKAHLENTTGHQCVLFE